MSPRAGGAGPHQVWLVNHHADVPSKDGSSGRHLGLAAHLPQHGWSMSLILSSVRNVGGRQALRGLRLSRSTTENGVRALWVRSNGYGKSGLLRVAGMITFSLSALIPGMTRRLPPPDVVIGSTVHLPAAWSALRLARRRGVPFVFEIRDVWPETLIDLGRLTPRNPVARILSAASEHLCRQADLIISPLPGVRGYLDDMSLTSKPFLWVSNGVDPGADRSVRGEERSSGGAAEFDLMYLGSHGNANGLDGLLDAFELAAAREPRLRLRLVGEGTQKARLMAKARGLACSSRIFFEDRVPRSEVLARARSADALVVNLERLPVYRYGISLNKLFDYMLSGRPTVIAASSLNNPIRDADAGLTVEAGDPRALADAMLEMSRLTPARREEMGRAGRSHVAEHYSYEALSARLAAALDEVTRQYRARREG